MVTAMSTAPIATVNPVAGNTNARVQAPRSTERAETRSSSDDALGLPPEGRLTPLAFDALLDATHVLMAATRNAGGDRTSPSQMFERNVADADERRLMAQKEVYRSGRMSQSGNEQLDRTSVDARQALRSGEAGDTQRQAASRLSDFSGTHARSERSASDNDIPRHAARTESSSSEGVFSRTGRAQASAMEASFTSRIAHSPGTGSALPASPPVAASPPAAQVQSATGRPNASNSQSPAQQVAQLMGASRVGEAESVRAPSSSAAAAAGRQATADPKTAGRSSTGGRADANSSARPSAGTDERVGNTARSAFDQLVRSIHLQSGARRSFARLQLDPPELGRMHINVRVEGAQLRIDIRTETAAARDLVAARAAELTAALQQHGINVERFDVTANALDENPHDFGEREKFGADVAADHERSVRDQGSSSRSRSSLSEAGVEPGRDSHLGPSVGGEEQSEVGAVAETRLDIMV